MYIICINHNLHYLFIGMQLHEDKRSRCLHEQMTYWTCQLCTLFDHILYYDDDKIKFSDTKILLKMNLDHFRTKPTTKCFYYFQFQF